MNSFNIINGHNGAKIGQVDVAVEDENDQEQPIHLRVEACIMQEYGMTWEERQAMRDRDGPTEPLKLIAIMDLVKTDDCVLITYTKPNGFQIYFRELLKASLLTYPTFFNEVVDVEFEVDGHLANDEDDAIDLEFPFETQETKGQIPRTKVLIRWDECEHTATEYPLDLETQTLAQAYRHILDLLCVRPGKRARA